MPPRPPPASTEAFPSLPLTPRVPSPLFLPRCSLSLPRTLFPLSVFLPERSRRRRRSPPPRPPPSPRLSDAPPSSAVTFPSLPRSHKTPDALERRHRRHLLPLHRRPSSLDSSPTERPRPRPRARWTRGEPLTRSPLLPMPFGRSSHCFRRTRELAASVPHHRRGQSHRGSKPGTPPCSKPHQEHVEPTSFPSRAPQRQTRRCPNSGRRLGARRRRLRPPQLLPFAPLDALLCQLAVAANHE